MAVLHGCLGGQPRNLSEVLQELMWASKAITPDGPESKELSIDSEWNKSTKLFASDLQQICHINSAWTKVVREAHISRGQLRLLNEV